MSRRRIVLLVVLTGMLALLGVQAGGAAQAKHKPAPKPKPLSPRQKLGKMKHIVVIYEENHSFDNLYGGWESVNGLSKATAAKTTQVSQAGSPYTCLLQVDVNLASPPLAPTCTDTTTGTSFTSAFANKPFTIDDYIKPADTTCPPPAQAFSFPNGVLKGAGQPGGCTRDMVHEFYQEQYDLNGGAQNRYVTGEDAVGLTMGHYDTKSLPIYAYLHSSSHPHYAILDDFFQAAFGGSFLNHQWLIAAATPTYPNPPANLRTILDSNGMPVKYPLYTPTGPVQRGPIAAACPAPLNLACGDYAVNTMQPTNPPFGTFGAKLPVQTGATIGDLLTAKKIGWAWYAGGWSNASGAVNGPGWTNGSGPSCSDPNVIPGSTYPNCPDNLFQFHHQPFAYFANYASGTPGRDHLKDEAAFTQILSSSTKTCGLQSVSFVKPIGENNEHPGYASTPGGESHLVALIKAVEGSACKKDTMVIVTYDEFGGQWDHVSPPGLGGISGPHDQWGPGTRVPALVIAPLLRGNFVADHTQHDTTSILATIEHRFGLKALGARDAAVKDLTTVFQAAPAK
jgi:acid phosphatase